MGVWVDEKLSVSRQWVLAAQKPNHVLGHIKTRVAKGGRGFCPSTLLLRDPTCGPQHRKDKDLLDQAQRRP